MTFPDFLLDLVMIMEDVLDWCWCLGNVSKLVEVYESKVSRTASTSASALTSMLPPKI